MKFVKKTILKIVSILEEDVREKAWKNNIPA